MMSTSRLVNSNPTYKPRKFRQKGAFLTLFWNFVALSLFIYFALSSSVKGFDHRYKIGFAVSSLMYPVAGLLADVYVGRYKVLKYSMLVVWLAGVLYVIAVILQTQFPASKAVDLYKLSTVILGLLGLSAFQANTIQFGVDQLVDASSSDISSYISWYAWLFFVAYLVVDFSQGCICPRFAAVSALLVPVSLTLCVCSDILFNEMLVKEPAGFNPLKLIFKVLRFAAKNKYPLQRSAFTYCEDKPYSRIDLAKDKYGGPFTTVQVEDVKTFFRITVIIIFGCLFSGVVYVVIHTVDNDMMLHYQDSHYSGYCSDDDYYLRDCYQRILVNKSGLLIMVVLIPALEFILYPLLWKCTIKYSIISKFMWGILLQLLFSISLMILEIVGHHMTSNDPSLPQNYNVTCMLKLESGTFTKNSTLVLSYKWLAIPKIFSGASVYCLITSSIEFFCAQSPYSMKGLIGGLTYCLCGFAVSLSFAMKLPFQLLFDKAELGKDIKFGCGVWYYCCVSLLSVAWVVVAVVATKCYSRRRRDENSHNEQIFSVNYYS